MKRAWTWQSVFLALCAACGDDSTMADASGVTNADTSGTTGDVSSDTDASTDDPTGTTATTVDGSTGQNTTGDTDTTTGTTGDTDDSTTGTGSTGDTDDSTGDTTTGETDTDGGVIPEGSVDQAGGQPADAVLIGNLAYIAAGPRVNIWDLADPKNAAVLGQSDPMPGLVTGIAVRGNRAYVSARLDLEGSLHVLDVSDPAAPVHVGAVDYVNAPFKVPTDVLIHENVLFVSDTENGIISLSLADPDAPAPIDAHPVFGVSGLDRGDGVIRYRVKAFIGGLDVGTIEHTDGIMSELGYASLPDQGIDLAFAGDRVYQSGFFGFFAYDLTDPDVALASYADAMVGRTVEAGAQAAYLFGDSGLTVYDGGAVVSPGLTVLSPTFRTLASSLAGGALLGATDLGLGLVFDVTDPLLPIPTGVFDLPVGTDPTAMAFLGEDLIVSDFYTGLRVVDAADWSSRGRFEIGGDMVAAEDVAVVGNLAYVVDWSTGLYVVDLADPQAPTFVGHVATGGSPSAVVVSGDYAYVGESTGGGALRVVDVSSPKSPFVVASLATTKVRDLHMVDNLVFVADEQLFDTGGMRIIDVSDPKAPTQLAHYTTCNSALGVAVEGSRAYLACAGDETLHVVDVTNPAQPVLEQSVGVGATGMSAVATSPDRVWLGHAYGITEVDNTNPDDPEPAHLYPTAMLVRRIAVTDAGTVYGAAGPGGVYRIQFTN